MKQYNNCIQSIIFALVCHNWWTYYSSMAIYLLIQLFMAIGEFELHWRPPSHACRLLRRPEGQLGRQNISKLLWKSLPQYSKSYQRWFIIIKTVMYNNCRKVYCCSCKYLFPTWFILILNILIRWHVTQWLDIMKFKTRYNFKTISN